MSQFPQRKSDLAAPSVDELDYPKQEMLDCVQHFSAAIVAKDHNPVIARFYRNLIANGKVPMKAVGASMRKLLHIIFGVLKSGTPFRDDLVFA